MATSADDVSEILAQLAESQKETHLQFPETDRQIR